MIAIVDCNSFYCSCERVFRPDILNKPVVVLSNNDGCIVSRTDEAKAIGVEMAGPYFKAKPLIEKYGVETFSSNYNLYGDMSWRVMETLRAIMGKNNVEVYSVDEAFINMNEVPVEKIQQVAMMMRETVERWTGVAVSVGVASTKVLSKVANHLAKKNKLTTKCVVVLDTQKCINEALCITPVKEIWGIGFQYAEKLKAFGVNDAYQLSQMPIEWAAKNLGGVVGVRLVKELKGEYTIGINKELTNKKVICTTRMFGTAVKELCEIKEAIATYTSRVAEKLRRQQGAASFITVFVVPKEVRKPGEGFRHGPMISSSIILSHPTSITNVLIKPALQLVEKIYRKGELYKKAGVIVGDIVPENTLQGNLFVPYIQHTNHALMKTIDNINFSIRDDVLKFAASGMARNWKMRQELRSPRYTSRWDELRKVK